MISTQFLPDNPIRYSLIVTPFFTFIFIKWHETHFCFNTMTVLQIKNFTSLLRHSSQQISYIHYLYIQIIIIMFILSSSNHESSKFNQKVLVWTYEQVIFKTTSNLLCTNLFVLLKLFIVRNFFIFFIKKLF